MTAWILFGLAASAAALLAILLAAERALRREAEEDRDRIRAICAKVRTVLPMNRTETSFAHYLLGDAALRDYHENMKRRNTK